MFDNLFLTAAIVFVGSFLAVRILTPKITWVVESRNLADAPDNRSSHKVTTPTMAGFAFFLVLLFSLAFIREWDTDTIGINLVASLALMFAIGLKDDLVLSTPKAKIMAELLAISFVIFCSCFQSFSLDGFLGIYNMPSILNYLIIPVIILAIINSYNLIDGIDGLATTVGIMTFAIFGVIFYFGGEYFYFLLSLALIGILLAYLPFNLSSSKKIFMGDTGSLIIGFCIGFMSIKFLSMEHLTLIDSQFQPENKLIVIAAILFIPLFDTIRVMGVRMLKKKSPFSPDKSHIHHILINCGIPHFKASFFLCFLNLVISVSLIFLSFSLNSFQMILVMALLFIALLGLFHKFDTHKEKRKPFIYLIRTIQFLF
ncbi:undecaprenyl/decaprenyl-phosphate alpha-N-acetylglucosaminyl 1-phosphate transferase [Paucihalobacter ruber]|uniref:Undecaprenyl/decaprenyl-phosphate alpha-N-acetylglucosaminyl 1-phosphate transferase n=1 Tax=Paucihalobacter ruber TaxID=2567861 RepID=A0A506PRS2_9FLAO|nr:MraY family glycosyltransferase [Paucihalobacter ruber]TPV35962.1 undecaprenyl/decaprenyl-phosphate alpha-N-acetylglucosaminyl 1-phosphate transferase [Paucihalobacter ruber]